MFFVTRCIFCGNEMNTYDFDKLPFCSDCLETIRLIIKEKKDKK